VYDNLTSSAGILNNHVGFEQSFRKSLEVDLQSAKPEQRDLILRDLELVERRKRLPPGFAAEASY